MKTAFYKGTRPGLQGIYSRAIGNLSFLFPLIPHSKRKWFCSEAIAAALGWAEPWRFGLNGLSALLRSILKGE